MMIASPNDDIRVDSETMAWSDTLSSQSEDSQWIPDQLTAQLFRLWRVICAQSFDVNSNETAFHLHNIGSTIAKIWGAHQENIILRGESFPPNSTDNTVYRDSLSVLIEAYFAAAQIMFSLAGSLAPAHSYLTSEDPCQVILSSASYLFRDRTAICCIGHDMFLPLTLLAFHGTSVEYRKMAFTFLKEQIRGMPFEGLMAIAVRHINTAGFQGGLKRLSMAH